VELGTLAREQGLYPEAWSLMERGIEFAEAFGDTTQIAHCLEGFACLATAQGQIERAFCLGGAAAALREATGAPLPPARRRVLERWLEVSRAALSDAAVAAAWHAGHEMPLKQAIAHTRAPYAPPVSCAQVAAEAVPARVPALLTPREREVTALISQGLTNRQIANRLVITDRTVAAHVEHILGKLGFSSRTQIGVWAAEHGLVAVNRF
jgi:DNA-binding CsgD family transcriptional regulator